MIGKLLKYEFRSTYKTFFLIYLILFLTSISLLLGTFSKNTFLLTTSSITMSFFVMASVIIYIVVIEKRFFDGLYRSEGYLMFTLPVEPWKIVSSKWLMASFWGIFSIFMGAFCASLVIYAVAKNESTAPISYSQMVLLVLGNGEFLRALAETTFLILTSGMNFIALIYLSIAIGYLPFIPKFHTLISIVVFFFLFYMEGRFSGNISQVFSTPYILSEESFIISSFVFLAVAVFYIAVTSLILTKKVSLK